MLSSSTTAITPFQYAKRIAETALYHRIDSSIKDVNIKFCQLGLAGEVGELAGEVKKVYRNDNGVLTPERRIKLIDEVGDCYWYFVRLAHHVERDLTYDFPEFTTVGYIASFGEIADEALWVYQKSFPLVSNPVATDVTAWLDFAVALTCFLQVCDSTPGEAMERNIAKLLGRKERGTIVGDGGER